MARYEQSLRDNNAWSAQAKDYEQLVERNIHSNPMLIPLQSMVRTLNEVKPLTSATAIMDAGCGTGVAITHLLNEYGSSMPSSARILASDFSEGMLDVLRETANRKTAEGNVIWSRLETQVLDLQDLSSLPEGSLSHIFSSFVFGIVPDNLKAFKEVNRVLATGGVLVEVTWSNIAWMDWIYSTIGSKWPGRPSTIPWPQDFKSTDGVKKLFEDAGFENVQTQELDGVMGDDNMKDFVTKFTRSKNPGTSGLFKGMSNEELEEAEEFLESDLQKRFPDGKVRMTGRAIIGVGFKK